MSKRDPNTCISCGLTHRLVEAGGVYHCPNKACTVSGNANYRSSLPSFRELSDGTHTVDWKEWALAASKESHEDPEIAAAIVRSAAKLLENVDA